MVDLSRLHSEYLAHVAALAAATARAIESNGFDALVIHSGSALKRSVFDDQYWPLRVVPHFAHWAPLEVGDCGLLVQPGKRPTLLRNVARDYWDGAVAIEDVRFLDAFEVIELADPEKAREHFPVGKKVAFVGEDLERAARWGFVAADAINPPALVRALDALRVKKSEYERVCLAEANRRAALGHARVREAFFESDHSELELHLLYLGATQQDDPETPYKNIVALGEHAAVLHHVHYGRRALGASSLLLDAGATFRGYASDVTRTWVKGHGAGADAFSHLVAGLEKLQQATCAAVRVGDKYEALHDHSHRLLAGVLLEVGVVRGASDTELVDGGITRLFLPHGLGHSLGLQCHDVGCALEKPRPDNPFLRNTSVIEPEQCFTIEPGCYFIPEKLEMLRASPLSGRVNWKLVGELAKLGGVRIEDDVVVRPAGEGVSNLTRAVLPG
jgi:Xaa-Pro dipeptidase